MAMHPLLLNTLNSSAGYETGYLHDEYLSIYPTCDTKLNTLVRASSVSVGVGEIYRFNYVGCSQYEVVGFQPS